jgi:hypothetical protein
LAKVDKSQYTKEEWRIIKEQRRQEKLTKQIVDVAPSPDNKYYVLCLKHGNKYSADYVNKLYNMVKRHCTLDYEFVCLTDNPKGINPNVKILPLPGGISGWWCKPYMFSKDLPINGTILYMDLDVVIANNIDKLFTWEPNRWCTIRDFTRAMRPNWQKYNSSVIRFKTGELDHVWTDFKKDRVTIQRRFHGDQDWLYEATHKSQGAMLYPDKWIQSWKWEIRKSKDLQYNMPRGERKLRTIENVTPPKECCICVFHGDPNPEHCEDPWVVKNWV